MPKGMNQQLLEDSLLRQNGNWKNIATATRLWQSKHSPKRETRWSQNRSSWKGSAKETNRKKPSSLTQEEIDTLFEKGVMGINLPQGLINTLCFNNYLRFGLRGGKERDLNCGDIVLKTDSHDEEYFEYSTEKQTKTRPGDNPLKRRSIKPRMYENLAVPTVRNPIRAYKFYKTKGPKETLVDV